MRSSPWTINLCQDLHHLERQEERDDWLRIIGPSVKDLLLKVAALWSFCGGGSWLISCTKLTQGMDAGHQLEKVDGERSGLQSRLLCFVTEPAAGPYLCLVHVDG